MRSPRFFVAAFAGLILATPAWSVNWTDFTDTFDAFTTGQTIATADPTHWDESIQGTNNGLLLLPAPGGGVALAYNPTTSPAGSQSRSDRVLGVLNAPTSTYRFTFRARVSTTVAGSDAFFFFKQAAINGYAFTAGIIDGMITLQGDATSGTSGTGTTLTAAAVADTWYEFRVDYSVVPGIVNDVVTLSYRAQGDPSFTVLGTLFTRDHDLHNSDPIGNVILGFIRPKNTALTGNFLDDLSALAIVPAYAAPSLNAAGLRALGLGLLLVGAASLRRRTAG